MSTPLSPEFDTRFADLLSAWNSHAELRSGGASVAELAASRWSLDERRTALR